MVSRRDYWDDLFSEKDSCTERWLHKKFLKEWNLVDVFFLFIFVIFVLRSVNRTYVYLLYFKTILRSYTRRRGRCLGTCLTFALYFGISASRTMSPALSDHRRSGTEQGGPVRRSIDTSVSPTEWVWPIIETSSMSFYLCLPKVSFSL